MERIRLLPLHPQSWAMHLCVPVDLVVPKLEQATKLLALDHAQSTSTAANEFFLDDGIRILLTVPRRRLLLPVVAIRLRFSMTICRPPRRRRRPILRTPVRRRPRARGARRAIVGKSFLEVFPCQALDTRRETSSSCASPHLLTSNGGRAAEEVS